MRGDVPGVGHQRTSSDEGSPTGRGPRGAPASSPLDRARSGVLSLRPSLLLPLCMALLCLACAARSVKEAALETLEREVEMTAEIHRQLRAQARFVTDPVLLDYVNEIGQRIVRPTEPQPFIYRFSVLQSRDLNAFTIGGGYVYISSAVLAQVDDVAELAAVLAHEIAHVRARHTAKAQQNQGLAMLASLAALAGGHSSSSQGINVSMQIEHTRKAETEADREGIEYMFRSGYSPDGMIRFFQRALAASRRAGRGARPYLFTHPALSDRIADVRADIIRLDTPPGLVSQDARLAGMQARLARSHLAGGTGRQARASFERGVSDPYLVRARRKSEDGDLARADEILAHAQELQPWDPRIVLARATLSERRGDLKRAKLQLQRAFEIDPRMPLVQYRLGSIHTRLGNHSRAVFYLEQAAIGFNVGSSGQRQAELAIEQLSTAKLIRSR